MNKNIVIIDEFFPYSNKEPFLESEINYYKNENIFIFSCTANCNMNVRKINNKNIYYTAEKVNKKYYRVFNKMKSVIYSIFSKEFIEDIGLLLRSNKLNLVTIKQLVSFIGVGKRKYYWIKNQLIELGYDKDSEIIFYSYWMHFHCYTAILLKKYFKNSKVVTRCHGFDLYEYRNKFDYIPLRKYITFNVDEIYTISNDGKEYLSQKYHNINDKISISRLGTNDYGYLDSKLSRDILKIVSCSWMTDVKRIHKIVEALEKINDICIEWTHYGDGELYSEIERLCNIKLGDKKNIKYNLRGSVTNKTLIEDYKNREYHLFINVSESEGIPVSIMEAQSFGIPVIATDVGGVPEQIYMYENGYLLNKEFKIEELTQVIRYFANLEDDEYKKYRECSRYTWETKYNAEYNYKEFINKIIL